MPTSNLTRVDRVSNGTRIDTVPNGFPAAEDTITQPRRQYVNGVNGTEGYGSGGY